MALAFYFLFFFCLPVYFMTSRFVSFRGSNITEFNTISGWLIRGLVPYIFTSFSVSDASNMDLNGWVWFAKYVKKNLCWVQHIKKKWKLINFMTHALTNPTYFTHILWCWSPDPMLCLNLFVHKCVLCSKTWAHHVPFLWVTLPLHQIVFLSKLLSSPPRLCHIELTAPSLPGTMPFPGTPAAGLTSSGCAFPGHLICAHLFHENTSFSKATHI